MKTCLIVDDSKVIRKVARHILETLEFEVDEAGDGQEALTRCEEKMPDVVLLDWNMPVMTGIDFVKAVRADEAYDAMKVVMVTSETAFEHLEEALKQGANEYVMKPFTAEILADKMALVMTQGA